METPRYGTETATTSGSPSALSTAHDIASPMESNADVPKPEEVPKLDGVTKIFLPEGSVIDVLKPEIRIDFKPVGAIPGDTVITPIKSFANVTFVQGLALERLKLLVSPDLLMDPSMITVLTRNGEELTQDRKLVDFIYPQFETLFVQYPTEEFTFKQPKSTEMELEEGCFAIFDS